MEDAENAHYDRPINIAMWKVKGINRWAVEVARPRVAMPASPSEGLLQAPSHMPSISIGKPKPQRVGGPSTRREARRKAASAAVVDGGECCLGHADHGHDALAFVAMLWRLLAVLAVLIALVMAPLQVCTTSS